MMSGSRALCASIVGSCLISVLAGCGGSGGAGAVFAAPATASFSPSGSAATENQVRLVGRSTGEDEVTVDVVIAGPTDSSDLYAFSFGLEVGDPTVAEYVFGSQEVGTALDTTGCHDPFLIVSPGMQPGLLTVSLTKLGNCPGNGIPAGEEMIIALAFQVEPERSTTIRLAGQSPGGDPSAIGSAHAVIDSVVFDQNSARFSGR